MYKFYLNLKYFVGTTLFNDSIVYFQNVNQYDEIIKMLLLVYILICMECYKEEKSLHLYISQYFAFELLNVKIL